MAGFARPGPICSTKDGFDKGTLVLTQSPIQGPVCSPRNSVVPEGQQRNIDPVSRIPDLIIDATASTPSGIDDYVKIINRGIEIISGSEAFRRYDWLKNVPEV